MKSCTPGTAVRSELLFDLKRDHVYVMTDRKLSKVRVQDCQQYTDCNQCLGAKVNKSTFPGLRNAFILML